MAPYSGLTPETLLDAIESCGVHCDGRLQGLNSYENRVYQAWLDDGSSVVAKFYRPQRWSAEAIQEAKIGGFDPILRGDHVADAGAGDQFLAF